MFQSDLEKEKLRQIRIEYDEIKNVYSIFEPGWCCLVMVNVSEEVWNRSVGQRERLVQTYIILYGLLLSCDQSVYLLDAQHVAVQWFFGFLVVVIVYYTSLSNITYDGLVSESFWYVVAVSYMEICAFFTSLIFSFVVVSYMMAVLHGCVIDGISLYGFWPYVIVLTLIIWRSLSPFWVNCVIAVINFFIVLIFNIRVYLGSKR